MRKFNVQTGYHCLFIELVRVALNFKWVLGHRVESSNLHCGGRLVKIIQIGNVNWVCKMH